MSDDQIPSLSKDLHHYSAIFPSLQHPSPPALPARPLGAGRVTNAGSQRASQCPLTFIVTAHPPVQQSSRWRRPLAKSINNRHGAEKFPCAKANPSISSQSLCSGCQELIRLITKSSFASFACLNQRR